MWNRAVALCCALALLAAGSRGGFRLATPPYTFVFPRDHYAHDSYRTEWWYFTGHLQTPAGHRFGYELTFFRVGLEPHAKRLQAGRSAWHSAQVYPAHFAVTDITGGAFSYDETFARDALNQGAASERALRVHVNDWTLSGSSELRTRMHLHARGADSALDLVEIPLKNPAVHGRGGVSQKAACIGCASHYYSFTRLATSGTIVQRGTRLRVTGISWMDHEFGSDELQPQQSGWDWFSIQLLDGRELMLYRLRRRDGSTTPQSSGSIVERDGSVRYLPLAAFQIEATGAWRSPHTNASYPSGWRVRVAGFPELTLTPAVADQELVNRNGTTYWEGAVDVRNGSAQWGAGYVELTGYAGTVQL